jgi:hypothetical protein
MGMTDIERRVLKGGHAIGATGAVVNEPMAVRLSEAIRLSGLSRSRLYRLASSGEVVFLKCGNRTMVDFPSLKAAVAALPRAVINIAA